MTRKEIIDGLKFTMDFILLNPITCESIAPDLLNRLDRITYDACKGAVELLEAQNGDVIKRQDTIEKMQEVDWYHQNKNGEMVHGANSAEHQAWYKAEDVYKVLEDMPPTQSEQSERQRGRWIEYIPEHGKCPFCGNQVDLLNGKANNFCGECGADMRGEQDGNQS